MVNEYPQHLRGPKGECPHTEILVVSLEDYRIIQPPSLSSYPSFPSPSTSDNGSHGQDLASSSSSTNSRISPAVLLVIVIVAIFIFVSGLLHLLVRFLIKRPSVHQSLSQSSRFLDNPGSDSLQRQLQQLFRLHDSGLDQALIDDLPVFYYEDIIGLKQQPFDCAVCLSEFSNHDKLRLLPMCSHAFHVNCIDTWLLSNSTCPLCRGAILGPGFPLENQLFGLNYVREFSNGYSSDRDNRHCHNPKPSLMEEPASERRVYSVRLGKFRSLNNGGENGEKENGETSNSKLDARRCYSLGSYQYVLGDSDLEVALSNDTVGGGGGTGSCSGGKVREHIGNSSVNGDSDGKTISRRNKGESLSVSKIWLWSKKGKFPGSSDANVGALPAAGLPFH
ncbi:hypothetical protein Nepgr_033266 [Nepenthes gracilis]|uniref:RING-type E3 ubiquitin transferase n=1 Tax=Nepenthes gracilis TaxID=150966 RepID=A0AAD3Y6S7_NEPGR|nr:hypothetical protein Nepgr_033266 [Nepenthes gracilis]